MYRLLNRESSVWVPIVIVWSPLNRVKSSVNEIKVWSSALACEFRSGPRMMFCPDPTWMRTSGKGSVESTRSSLVCVIERRISLAADEPMIAFHCATVWLLILVN